ncbi:MAG: transglutaminase family protein [Gammaproteobacteria bacterium]|nr:transglutaminase family protein [Gammaproteobacteria bacterium]
MSMRFQIVHTTRYLYQSEVFLEPHTLRLRPRCDTSQQLRHFSLSVEPRPLGQADSLDLDGNSQTLAWFGQLTSNLTVISRATVDTLRVNPFNFLVTAQPVLGLPAEYPDAIHNALSAYREPAPDEESVAAFARGLAHESSHQTIAFLTLLARRISEQCKSTMREGGPPNRAAETLEKQEGACRDLAVLFIECCRHMGLAARFVSGYHEDEACRRVDHMHAWAEVYLPGAGWRGFDPSTGLAVADRHVALAASAHPEQAAPLVGTLRGNNVCSSMYAEVQIEVTTDEE